ncbi:hydroxymethylbilane synthase [Sphingomicrobium clamense]|uniref:Porphobilinogen deaminase n=1 Tax=Sphingomicrobium clamense TaxID=2851013 RepID=A0ABS6V4H9_9SPHN|nr:hydroxymethylbilane synthase [Sphingomicrobium sp. B8]MBW0143993.1 hydroxymethylbilane synthase [Sphingomicrobium sp. B8]
MTKSLRLGTRGSPLAVIQAEMVAAALKKAHGCLVEIVTLKTSGDRIQNRPLAEIGGKAVWTKELDRALLAGETDLSVHSMKDVESERPEGLGIAAILERADRRDRLIGAERLDALREGAIIGTSSPRRAAQLRHLRPDLKTVNLRGNVATRMKAVDSGQVDATLLAAAGLDRLGLVDVGHALDDLLPAPAQGAVGIDAREDDLKTRNLLAAIDHAETHEDVLVERAFVRALGGDCHSPVAAAARHDNGRITLDAALYAEDGSACVTGSCHMAVGDADPAIALAETLLSDAPPSIRELFT